MSDGSGCGCVSSCGGGGGAYLLTRPQSSITLKRNGAVSNAVFADGCCCVEAAAVRFSGRLPSFGALYKRLMQRTMLCGAVVCMRPRRR